MYDAVILEVYMHIQMSTYETLYAIQQANISSDSSSKIYEAIQQAKYIKQYSKWNISIQTNHYKHSANYKQYSKQEYVN